MIEKLYHLAKLHIKAWNDDHNDKIGYRNNLIQVIEGTNFDFEFKEKTIDKLLGCSQDTVVFFNKTKQLFEFQPYMCKKPYCPICKYWYIKRQRKVLQAKIKAAKEKYESHLFVVFFTKRGDNQESPEESLNRLRSLLTNIKRKVKWKDLIQGGSMMVEFTLSFWKWKDGNWHYHCNALLDVLDDDVEHLFWDMHDMWCDSNRDTEMRHVRGSLVDVDDEKFIREIVKYNAKEFQVKNWNEDPYMSCRYFEEIMTLKKRRMLSTFGRWYGKKLPIVKDPSNLHHIGLLSDIKNPRTKEMDYIVNVKEHSDLLYKHFVNHIDNEAEVKDDND